MAQVTQLIHDYLRHSKKFPHVFCPGCGHGIVLGSLIRSVHSLGIPKDDIVLVAGIGCSGRIPVYVDFNTVHTTHGRALTFATGIKLANPRLKVIVVMGDGDALSIGGNHLIHAARRNIGLTTLVLNNHIYGMTGGQSSSTTPFGCYSTTTPFGQMEKEFDIAEVTKACGANFVARATVMQANLMDRMISTALEHPGFNLVELITPCHTQFGRKNKYKSTVDMYKWLKKNAVPVEKYQDLSPEKQKEKIATGIFVQKDCMGLEQRYSEIRQKIIGEAK
ncbi:2-oxoacid:ferredoxin oxidoreductase subunit beta [Desulfonatronovibrio hydrogenovorans]|uniref:2-oxoacid:ferredoxin oxidoreductase subunit beta n=1 Tax=Desulfonatronovibrio hydrogenovorans TaxID=53245 RepID=UPI000491EB99|nr:2-oxoacid:ferredoxin oxidoreductase subunit beta [Desulfonatronovibrio hydrogenovorans]